MANPFPCSTNLITLLSDTDTHTPPMTSLLPAERCWFLEMGLHSFSSPRHFPSQPFHNLREHLHGKPYVHLLTVPVYIGPTLLLKLLLCNKLLYGNPFKKLHTKTYKNINIFRTKQSHKC